MSHIHPGFFAYWRDSDYKMGCLYLCVRCLKTLSRKSRMYQTVSGMLASGQPRLEMAF